MADRANPAGVNRRWTAQDVSTLRTLVYFSAAMLFLPIAAFFATQKFLFQGLLDYDVESSGIGGVVVAVAIIHVLIGFYIWLAYKEEAAPKQD